MSLVNDMLRDLDQRQSRDIPATAVQGYGSLTQPQSRSSGFRKKMAIAAVSVGGMLAIIGALYFAPYSPITRSSKTVPDVAVKPEKETGAERQVPKEPVQLETIQLETPTPHEVSAHKKGFATVASPVEETGEARSVSVDLSGSEVNPQETIVVKQDVNSLVSGHASESVESDPHQEQSGSANVPQEWVSDPRPSAPVVPKVDEHVPAQDQSTQLTKVKLSSARERDRDIANQGLELVKQGRQGEAVSALLEFISDAEYIAESGKLLAGMYLLQHEVDHALKLIAKLDPEDPDVRLLHARALVQTGNASEALSILAGRIPPVEAHADYHALLAALYQQLNLHELAIQYYAQLVNVYPDSGDWWVGLGISLEAIGKRQSAVQAYRRATTQPVETKETLKQFALQRIGKR
ncbi:TPR repeat protein [Oleiphilus messinensis]|uniref:TPR repeat protein n=1 Tax=Oleiphilus messinensis TaxID=141451 RepID=A0A1Y0I5U7_9GAMM|nr:tetratricopeptide repeat protein [Oleiphilus messinensis]ARU54814.1 TPR repeat protein [Oleiphilus messinensis]